MKNMKKIAKAAGTLGLMGCAVMSSQFAMAEEPFWYVGGNVGQSRAKIDNAGINSYLYGSGLNMTSISDDDRHTAYKLFGGYQLNKNIAFEAGYFSLGQFGYTAYTSPAGTLNGNIKLKGMNIDVVGMLPIVDKVSVLGRLGLNYAQAKDGFSSTGNVATPTSASPGKNAVNYKAGLGLQYDLTESLGLRAEAERYRINDAVGSKGDISMYSLGLVYRFKEKKPAPVQQAAVQPAPAPAPIRVIVPVVKMQQYCSILDIQYEIKQEDIQREEKEKLSVVGTFMNKYPETTALIEGHTDNVGTSEFNLKLSQHRAENVVSYLVDNLHIAASRLTAIGYGDSRPIADNSTNEGKQANRRIGAVIACAKDIAGLKVLPARITMAMEVDFDPRKAEIDPQYYDGLNQVADFMKANPTVTATVEGHASKMVGNVPVSADEAMQVSERRAQSVVKYLVEKQGVSRSRLATAAYGKSRRVSYGTTLEERQENRRVNIILNYEAKK